VSTWYGMSGILPPPAAPIRTLLTCNDLGRVCCSGGASVVRDWWICKSVLYTYILQLLKLYILQVLVILKYSTIGKNNFSF